MDYKEEIALPIKEKSRLKCSEFINYFGMERLGLSKQILEDELLRFSEALNPWEKLLNENFLEKTRACYKS